MPRAIHRFVDQALRMLDAKADRKWLGLDGDAVGIKHGEDVAGAVPHRQDHMIGGDLFAVLQPHALDRTVFDRISSVTLLSKRYSPPSPSMVGAERFHHRSPAGRCRYGDGPR